MLRKHSLTFFCRKIFSLIVINSTTLIAVLFISSCSSSREPPPRTSVAAVVVKNAPVIESHQLSGEIFPRHDAILSFRVSGKIITRQVDNGATVNKGQLIATLDPTNYQLAVTAAQSNVADAQFALRQATADEKRLNNLSKRGAVSRVDHERQETQMKLAIARLDKANAQLTQAQNNLAYTQLYAPFQGIINQLKVEVGENVQANQPVASLINYSQMELLADIPESLINDIKTYNSSMILWSQPKIIIPLKLREIMPVAAAETKTFQAKYTILNPEAYRFKLLTGMTAKLTLTRKSQESYETLPANALIQTDAGAGVWVFDKKNDQVKFLPVKIKQYELDKVVVEGLLDGMIVITTGTQKILPSSKVTVNIESSNESSNGKN